MEHILPNRGRKLVGKQQQETSINETMMRKEKWKKEIELLYIKSQSNQREFIIKNLF